MKKLFNYLLFTCLYLISGFFNPSSAQTTCVASAPSQIRVGQPFNYTVTLNEKATQITTTNFNNFNVLNGPNTGYSSSISTINGRTTQTTSYTYTYTLSAKSEGSFTIPPTTFKVDNKTIKSNSVTITISKGEPQNQNRKSGQHTGGKFNEKDVFIKATASKSNPFLGEQVVITHKLYIGPSVNGGYRVDNINIPSQSGLWSYTLGDPKGNSNQTTEVVDGKRFTVFEIRKTAVFPQKAGEIIVTPMEMKFIARVISQQSSGDPFFDQFFGNQSARDYELNLNSNKVILNVKPLPSSQPENFSGLSGSFSIKALLSRDQLKTNDATNLTITISGSGNLQHIESLNLNFPTGIDVSDPKITDNINTKGTTVSGTRIFEYVIIPRNTGTFTIPSATFSYFDLKTNTYKTLTSESFSIKVEKGSGENSVITNNSNQKNIKILGNDIRFIKSGKTELIQKQVIPFFGSTAYFTLMLTPILIGIILIILRRKQIEYYSNVALVKNKRAKKLAQSRLKNGLKLLKSNQIDQFYIEISRALWGYLSDKYHIPLSQLSLENVEIILTEKGISNEIVQQFVDTLQQCEFARFAPGDKKLIMNEMYQKALDFILYNESVGRN